MEILLYIWNKSFTKNMLLTLILIIIAYSYGRYKLNYWKRKGVKQLSNTNIILGNFKNLILYRAQLKLNLDDIYNVDSDAACIGFYIFHKPCLLLKDVEIIKQILIRDFHNFSDRHFGGLEQKDSFGMKNLFGVNNPEWKYSRQNMTSTLTKLKQKQMLPLMMANAKSMTTYLRSHFESNDDPKIIDIQDLNYKLSADIIANIALGIKIDSFKNPESDYMKYVMAYFRSFKRMVAFFIVYLVPELVAIFGSQILFNSSVVRKIFWDSIGSREKSGMRRGDFIDSILDFKNGTKRSMYPLDNENLLFQSSTFFPGFESSMKATLFILTELAKHKEYQERARQDVQNAVGKHGWTVKAFDEMKYLHQCIEESNRLHPAVPTLDRYTLCDYKIPNTDIIIEKGTPIFISVDGLHTDERYFDEPKVYNPNRFSRKKNNAYIPFGLGYRKCIGIQLGMLHVKIVTAVILWEYKIHRQPEKDDNGFNIAFTKIKA